MAQWAQTIRFLHDRGSIEVMAHLDTGTAFAPARRDSKIDELLLMDLRGDAEVGNKLFQELRSKWIGETNEQWIQREQS